MGATDVHQTTQHARTVAKPVAEVLPGPAAPDTGESERGEPARSTRRAGRHMAGLAPSSSSPSSSVDACRGYLCNAVGAPTWRDDARYACRACRRPPGACEGWGEAQRPLRAGRTSGRPAAVLVGWRSLVAARGRCDALGATRGAARAPRPLQRARARLPCLWKSSGAPRSAPRVVSGPSSSQVE